MIETIVRNESRVLLGDEAVARAALDSGISAAYGYPGTPSTEILEYLLSRAKPGTHPVVSWCVNEKTAYEEALGVSMVGRRALVTMKHVGLNVASDAFINSALVDIRGGLVLAVADDPGMHSSQNEQDSRFYADFARVVCLEPMNQQEAYDMTRAAFELSERFRVPVVLRLVTRLAHSRGVVDIDLPRHENPLSRPNDRMSWVLLPASARRQWKKLLAAHEAMTAFCETTSMNRLLLDDRRLGVITAGVAGNYLRENFMELAAPPSHLHIGAYPLPVDKVRELADHVETILVLEDGYPFIEDRIRGICPKRMPVRGRRTGNVPPAGELDPDVVRAALELPARILPDPGFDVVDRPPRLCQGCPHRDAYASLREAVCEFADALVMSDIGCYTLGALPPFSAIESCVCMGASIGMAVGAAEAGFHPVAAVIGDSTFLHSGMTALADAVQRNAPVTVLILDNSVVAMTGAQETVLSHNLERVILGLGVDPDHFRVIASHPRRKDEISATILEEIHHRGLSVILLRRECVESVRKRKSAPDAGAAEVTP